MKSEFKSNPLKGFKPFKGLQIVMFTGLNLLNAMFLNITYAQNVGVNTTGAAPDSKHLLEVLQPSITDNSIGIYVKHSGADATKTLYGFQSIRDGAGLVNVAAYLQAINGTSNYALIVPPGGGNVGIGTTSPALKTHIYDEIDGQFTGLAIDNRKTYGVGTGTNETSRLVLSLSTSLFPDPLTQIMGYIEAGTEGESTSFNGYLALGSRVGNAETEKLRITSSGNVGIGTSAPTSKLHIDQDNAAIGLLVTGGNTGNILARFQRDVGSDEKFDIIPSGGDIFTRYEVNPAGTLWNVGVDESGDRFSIWTGGGAPASTDEFSIQTDGNVGIGCTSPSQKLYVSGNIYATGTVLGSQVACSDIRWKKDFEPLTGTLNAVLSMRGLYYNWKKEDFPEKEFSSKREIGLIAQEVEKLYPELIFTDDKGFKYLDYSHLTPVLVEAIKEQQRIIIQQNQEIGDLKVENIKKGNDINGLKSEIDEIKAILDQQSKK